MTEQQVDPYQEIQYLRLKNRALLERISNLTATYEDQDAERRIAITYLEQELKAYKDAHEAQAQVVEEPAEEPAE